MINYIEFKLALNRYEDLLNEANAHRRYREVLRGANPMHKLVAHLQALLHKPAPEQKPAMHKGLASQQ